MKEVSEGTKIRRENKKLLFRVREIENELLRLRMFMKEAAREASDIREFIEQGMTQRAGHYAGALQRKLEVERAGGPAV